MYLLSSIINKIFTIATWIQRLQPTSRGSELTIKLYRLNLGDEQLLAGVKHVVSVANRFCFLVLTTEIQTAQKTWSLHKHQLWCTSIWHEFRTRTWMRVREKCTTYLVLSVHCLSPPESYWRVISTILIIGVAHRLPPLSGYLLSRPLWLSVKHTAYHHQLVASFGHFEYRCSTLPNASYWGFFWPFWLSV